MAIVIACCLLSTARSHADDPSFTAEVDRTELTMSDTLTLQLTFAGGRLNASRPVMPAIPGFRASFAGQSQNYSFVNGAVASQITFTYALEPQSPGEYTLPAVSVQVEGRTLSTQPIAVKVLPAAATPAAPAPGTSAPADTGTPREDIFIATAVDKKSPYVGEPATLSFRFYSRARLLSQPSYSPPSVTGFLTEDLPPQRQYTEILGGKRYAVVELKTALFPAAAGKAVIGPAALECSVEDFSQDPSGDPFRSLFGQLFAGGKPVTLRSDPITLSVLPLPTEGRPQDFKGDVGRYALSASLDKSQALTHEPVTLTIAITGEGNVKALSGPDLPPLPGFKVYETLSSLNISKTNYRVQGSKVFKTVLKPDVSGDLAVPALSFSFFDPAARAYKTVRTAPLVLKVAPAPQDSAGGETAPAPSLEGVKVVGQDIRYIHASSALKPLRPPFTNSTLFKILNLAPPFAFLALWLLRLLRKRSAQDPAGLAFRRARAGAEKALRAAAAHLQRGDLPAYYAALHKILLEYIGDKTALSPRGLTWETAAARMAEAGVPADAAAAARALWEDFDRARFTPSLLTREEADRHGRKASEVVKLLEASWKK